jgi:hypothetical protein
LCFSITTENFENDFCMMALTTTPDSTVNVVTWWCCCGNWEWKVFRLVFLRLWNCCAVLGVLFEFGCSLGGSFVVLRQHKLDYQRKIWSWAGIIWEMYWIAASVGPTLESCQFRVKYDHGLAWLCNRAGLWSTPTIP